MITRGNLSKINTFPRVIDVFFLITKNRREPLLIPGDFRVSVARAFQIARLSRLEGEIA